MFWYFLSEGGGKTGYHLCACLRYLKKCNSQDFFTDRFFRMFFFLILWYMLTCVLFINFFDFFFVPRYWIFLFFVGFFFGGGGCVSAQLLLCWAEFRKMLHAFKTQYVDVHINRKFWFHYFVWKFRSFWTLDFWIFAKYLKGQYYIFFSKIIFPIFNV